VTFGERLGDGSFSITFAARAGRVPCAVKFSRESLSDEPAVARERDSVLNLMLDCNGHPHIATLHYVDDNLLGHLATIWERGDRCLHDRLLQCQAAGLSALPAEELIAYMTQAAEGLDYMHGKGFVHRDIKPENVLMFRNQVKLIDFGFARVAELRSTVNSTRGTPVYAPPEAEDERTRLDPAYDIYSLAGMYIRLSTGQFPFGRGEDLRQRKLRGEFYSLGMPPNVVEVLRGALSADPRRRCYRSSIEFVSRLRDAVAGATTKLDGGEQAKTPAKAGATSSGGPQAVGGSTGGGAFIDIVDQLRQREADRLEKQDHQRHEARLRRIDEFTRMLHRYKNNDQLPLAYGTVLALLREDAGNAEHQKLKKFLEGIDPETGRPRCCDANGQRYALIPAGEFLMGSKESPQENQPSLERLG
jgi:serine/threonine protein kinase